MAWKILKFQQPLFLSVEIPIVGNCIRITFSFGLFRLPFIFNDENHKEEGNELKVTRAANASGRLANRASGYKGLNCINLPTVNRETLLMVKRPRSAKRLGSVSLFNGISKFVGYLMTNSFLLKKCSDDISAVP